MENIIKDIRNHFRLKKDQNYTAIKDKQNSILGDIKNLFEYEKEEANYKQVNVTNFWSNNYIEYKSNGDRNKTLSVENILIKLEHI